MLHIYTRQGKRYLVNDKGEITQYGNRFSGQWKMLGIGKVTSYRIDISFAEITPELLSQIDMQYKNGKPRYTVHDSDHGTHRQWGDGISSMWFD